MPLRTERLLLRAFRDEDLAPFAAINADPKVTEHLPGPLTLGESDAMVARIRAHHEARGYGLWAVEVVGEAPFIGFVGLTVPRFTARFTPCVEVGWRLASSHWSKGYATEGARAAVAFGFEEVGLDEIVSFTVPENQASRRVMEKLGMQRAAEDDFDHPSLPEGHRLRRHVLYRLKKIGQREGRT
jgi:RimJ/RimL family protein N-acetyltransferase